MANESLNEPGASIPEEPHKPRGWMITAIILAILLVAAVSIAAGTNKRASDLSNRLAETQHHLQQEKWAHDRTKTDKDKANLLLSESRRTVGVLADRLAGSNLKLGRTENKLANETVAHRQERLRREGADRTAQAAVSAAAKAKRTAKQ